MDCRGLFLLLSLYLIENSVPCFSKSNSQRSEEQSKQQEKPLIRFKPDGKLKLVIFADLHYGEAPDTNWGPLADLRSTNVTTNILSWENPDFVVFTGDQLTAEEMYSNGSEYIHILMRPLVQNNYRWASTYGNHDIGQNVSRLEILWAEQQYNLSYTTQMNESLPGVTNYYLPIYSSTGNSPVMIWWFFDSQGGRTDAGQEPHYVDPAVVQWFRDENARLRVQWGLLPSLVFVHIPPVEYEPIQENINDNPLCSGLVDDDVTAQDINTGIMQALASAGGVRTVFVGHDHGNAWCCFYEQIQVCYNKHTGYGGYGSWVRGARVLDLDLNNKDRTRNYIRLETGEMIDEFPNRQTL